MSNLCITWALQQQTGSPSKKLILFKLADQANDDGISWPSKHTISRHCELHAKTVQRLLRELQDDGLIRIEERKNGSVNLTNIYHLNLRGVGAQDSPPGAEDSQGWEHRTPQNPQSYPSRNPPSEPKGSSGGGKNGKQRDELFEAVVAECGMVLSELTKPERGKANKAVKAIRDVGATPADVHARAQSYRKRWPNCDVTPTGLANNWSKLKGPTSEEELWKREAWK